MEITAAILAGGAGTRVESRDKGLLPLLDRPLIAHVAAALRSQATTILVCANRNQNEYAWFGEVVADAVAGFKGPLAGIAAALARCKTPWLLTVPVDSPDLSHDFATRLADAAISAGAEASVAHDGVRRQPLFALYHSTLAASAADALARDLAPWRWQKEIGAVEVDFSAEPQAFANLNTLEEFREWERRHGV
ncbi:MAG: molybdenum cofactor guanylyltransferase [Gammaproteobacteria bacterium]|nr:MAG: molybdenum cofactor guanylyltransferase [Gammaproteobacteria bacterium]